MIQIPKSIVDEIIIQALSELPNEACGLLAGNDNVIKKKFGMINADVSPEHFTFDPSEQFKVMRAARTENLKIIANYHSHPETPARPSIEDIRLAYDENIIYVIVSLAFVVPEIKAYRIRQGEVEKIHIEILQ